MKTDKGNAMFDAKFILSIQSKEIVDEDFKNFFVEFEAKIKDKVVWKLAPTQMEPINIMPLPSQVPISVQGVSGFSVANFLKENPCLEIDMKVSFSSYKLNFYSAQILYIGENQDDTIAQGFDDHP